MQKLIGIIPTDDGTFVQVTLTEDQKSWKVSQVKNREIQDNIANILLFNSGVLLGVQSHWLHQNSPDYLDFHTASASVDDFYACTKSAHYQLFCETLNDNLLGVYPDDAYLCTIPLFTTESPVESFVSLAKEGNIYKVGIVIESQLIVAFSLPSCDSRQMRGYLLRIKRYWNNLQTGIKFPEIIYALDVKDFNVDIIGDIRHVSFQPHDINIVKAAGVALCGLKKTVPRFSGETNASHFKEFRAFTYITSAVIVLAAIFAFAVTGIMNIHYSYKIEKCKVVYNNIIDQNKEIRDLLKTGGNLAEKLARVYSVGSKQSTWAKLLHLLGSDRPQGLFIDKLGSDPIQKGTKVKIALAGWSQKETAVTEMLKKLNASLLVTNVTLANLERDAKNKNIYTFKILCQLK